MTLAIIGTAGRKDDADKLSLDKWSEMKKVVYKFIVEHDIKSIISGGAAYADHLAVGLYNAKLVDELTLALPCKFDSHKCQFHDTGVVDWRTNPGNTSNYYHLRFSTICKIHSLLEISSAIKNGAKVEIEPGFMARNSIVAQADMLLAFTFGNKNVLKDGGTADTLRKYIEIHETESKAYHCDLNDMKIYDNALA